MADIEPPALPPSIPTPTPPTFASVQIWGGIDGLAVTQGATVCDGRGEGGVDGGGGAGGGDDGGGGGGGGGTGDGRGPAVTAVMTAAGATAVLRGRHRWRRR